MEENKEQIKNEKIIPENFSQNIFSQQDIFSAETWFVEGIEEFKTEPHVQQESTKKIISTNPVDNSPVKVEANNYYPSNEPVKVKKKKGKYIIMICVIIAIIFVVFAIIAGLLSGESSNHDTNFNVVYDYQICNISLEEAEKLLDGYNIEVEYMYSTTIPEGYVISAGTKGWYRYEGEDHYYVDDTVDSVGIIVSVGSVDSCWEYCEYDYEIPDEESIVIKEGKFYRTWYEDEYGDKIEEGLDWCEWEEFYSYHNEELPYLYDEDSVTTGAYEIENDVILCVKVAYYRYRPMYEVFD